MENRQDAARARVLLDALGDRMQGLGDPLRALADKADRDIVPAYDVLEALREDLCALVRAREELDALGMGMGGLFLEELPRTDHVKALEDYVAQEGRRGLLGTLSRMRTDDAACMAAIAAVRERYCSCEEQADAEEKYAALELFIEAFRAEKPMESRRMLGYSMKLAPDFPEVMIFAALTNEPPIYLAEDASEEVLTEETPPSISDPKAESPAQVQEEHTTTEESVSAGNAQAETDAATERETDRVELVRSVAEERIETTAFDRVRALCAERHPLVSSEDRTAETEISAKSIKRYLTKAASAIGNVRATVLRMGLDSVFSPSCPACRTDMEVSLVSTVLADAVQRGFLRVWQFEGLPLLYSGTRALKKLCAAGGEPAKLLKIRDKSAIDLDSMDELKPHEAVAAILHEKGLLHGMRRKAIMPELRGGVGGGCGILSCVTPHINELMAFLLDAPDRRWIKTLCKRRTELSPRVALLAYDESHLAEMCAFLTEQLGEQLRMDEYYLFADDEWNVCASEDTSVSEEEKPEMRISESNAHDSVVATKFPEERPVPAEGASAVVVDEPSTRTEVEGVEPPSVQSVTEVAPSMTEEKSPAKKQVETRSVEENAQPATASPEIVPPPMDAAKITAELHAMLEAEDFASASAYLHAAAYFDPSWAGMNRELSYALYAPLQKCRYSSDSLMNIYFAQADGETHEGLAVAAMLWNFYLDHTPYDYAMQSLMDMARIFSLLKDVPGLSDVLYSLVQFKQRNNSGVDKYADYRLRDKSRIEEKKAALEIRAKEFEGKYIYGHITENGSNRRFIETQKLLFDHGDYLAQSLHAIVEGDMDAFEVVREYVSDTFLESGGGVDSFDVQNISTAKIEKLIDNYWYKAGDLVSIKKQSSKLVGNFRTTLQKRLEKIVALLVEWLDCIGTLGIRDTDDAFAAYNRLRPLLLSQLQRSAEGVDGAALPAWEISVLRRTLTELTRRIDGDYDEKEYHYFYVDFLRTPYVLLDADFLPIVTRSVEELEEFFPLYRIEQHFHAEKPSLTERLRCILNDSDDLGSARHIVHVLEDRGSGLDPALRSAFERVDEGMILRRARRCRDDFIESLELAQSYGQIESSTEDKKEKILQSINVVYERCQPSFDYGFFADVVAAFQAKIGREALRRGKTLQAELAALRDNISAAVDEDDEKRRAEKFARIETMIAAKNYTVAEDMLHRFSADDDDSPLESLQTDELRDFLHDYEMHYRKVYDAGRPLRTLLRFKGHNKAERGGDKLVESWLQPGGTMDVQRIRALLQQLGFSISNVRAIPRMAKTEQYEVLLAEAAGGRRSFSHPFAAFGSKGARAPFRVICLYGRFDADALIAKFNEIGTAKHTIVLLDYALSKDQRNRLARKTKSEIPGCAFALVDRVVAAYIAEHYEETKLPQMLFSITMPYTFYQPYIPDAVNAMPPEMFIGRKEALDKIIHPLGENIIYGGRQLGKSALLRMAERSVNRLGDGSCGLMIDIKSCDVGEAALRISRALSDRRIFTEPFETRDWAELARAIHLRLQDEEQRIPYLLLLIDEADAFIESCKAVDYRPFEELKNIQTIGQERFKFVIAGLRNVVRFDKEALSNNSVLAHLKSYTVRPFSVMEAHELLEVPLACLGLRFPAEKQALVSTILATTNYFPGLIQLYCYKLLEAMKKDYAGYDEAGSPPYDISEKHIKKVLAESDFQRDIYNKFDITLRVDEDCYYHIIAILMASLYYDRNDQSGYLPEDILMLGQDLGIARMLALPIEKVRALMEELRELNVLRRTANGRYLFTRYNFFQLMGTRDKLEEALLTYMEEDSDGTNMVG